MASDITTAATSQGKVKKTENQVSFQNQGFNNYLDKMKRALQSRQEAFGLPLSNSGAGLGWHSGLYALSAPVGCRWGATRRQGPGAWWTIWPCNIFCYLRHSVSVFRLLRPHEMRRARVGHVFCNSVLTLVTYPIGPARPEVTWAPACRPDHLFRD